MGYSYRQLPPGNGPSYHDQQPGLHRRSQSPNEISRSRYATQGANMMQSQHLPPSRTEELGRRDPQGQPWVYETTMAPTPPGVYENTHTLEAVLLDGKFYNLLPCRSPPVGHVTVLYRAPVRAASPPVMQTHYLEQSGDQRAGGFSRAMSMQEPQMLAPPPSQQRQLLGDSGGSRFGLVLGPSRQGASAIPVISPPILSRYSNSSERRMLSGNIMDDRMEERMASTVHITGFQVTGKELHNYLETHCGVLDKLRVEILREAQGDVTHAWAEFDRREAALACLDMDGLIINALGNLRLRVELTQPITP
jgi:hypothetical protein